MCVNIQLKGIRDTRQRSTFARLEPVHSRLASLPPRFDSISLVLYIFVSCLLFCRGHSTTPATLVTTSTLVRSVFPLLAHATRLPRSFLLSFLFSFFPFYFFFPPSAKRHSPLRERDWRRMSTYMQANSAAAGNTLLLYTPSHNVVAKHTCLSYIHL